MEDALDLFYDRLHNEWMGYAGLVRICKGSKILEMLKTTAIWADTEDSVFWFMSISILALYVCVCVCVCVCVGVCLRACV